MAKTATELVTAVKSIVGRTGDTALITDEFVIDALNDAQREICEKTPGVDSLIFKNTGSLSLVTDQISYSVTDISVTDPTTVAPAYIFDGYYVNGAQSQLLSYLPVDEFDLHMIDPTSSDHGASKPRRWTQRGQDIELSPRPSSDYNGDTLRVDGQRYAAEFTLGSTSASDISRADEGLIRHAVGECYAAMGQGGLANYMIWQKRFEEWYETFNNRQTSMMAWDDNVFFDPPGAGYGSY